jgi:hypothetical protein
LGMFYSYTCLLKRAELALLTFRWTLVTGELPFNSAAVASVRSPNVFVVAPVQQTCSSGAGNDHAVVSARPDVLLQPRARMQNSNLQGFTG